MSGFVNKPSEPEDDWPNCKVCGEKCFTNPGSECLDCNSYPLCNWCSVKKNCCKDVIARDPKWSEDKQFSKPVGRPIRIS